MFASLLFFGFCVSPQPTTSDAADYPQLIRSSARYRWSPSYSLGVCAPPSRCLFDAICFPLRWRPARPCLSLSNPLPVMRFLINPFGFPTRTLISQRISGASSFSVFLRGSRPPGGGLCDVTGLVWLLGAVPGRGAAMVPAFVEGLGGVCCAAGVGSWVCFAPL